tara:strand:- start:54 stop:326 length:273 start_codon:yes stop_codon:yes gene_type:complete
MVLSVLHLGPSGEYILYDGDQKKGILMGSETEMYEWKDKMETAEQHKANQEYMNELLNSRRELLISAGHSQQSAEDFLMKQMPYLYEKLL